MAIQTPFHAEGFGFPHQGHPVDPTVTGFAADPLVDMNAVIEINEIRNVVHTDPFDRAILTKARPDGLQRGTISPHLLVAVHADLGRRNACKR